ncbi:hypothetical protein Patl1_08623 [Pistacia atlantica]|uniref:Uncharacterized protein n=1 Tax=Pistacia atlantica TaxID=434234 RepID=A0ACC1AJ61_9ROSI|nr:hypothetical protein Patl1_08623 [Pistacia atlantica]
MATMLTANEVNEITVTLEDRGNKERKLSTEVAAEQNRLIETLERMDVKFLNYMEEYTLFELGFIVGALTKHTSSRVKALIALRNLRDNMLPLLHNSSHPPQNPLPSPTWTGLILSTKVARTMMT